jgi:hypothetical protein
VNALARPEVGEYLNPRFVSTYVKVATFKIAGKQKQGGNVASYFCTPDGRVLHAVAGPVDARTLLREARWAVDAWKLFQHDHPDGDLAMMRSYFLEVHSERLLNRHGVNLNDDRPGGRRLDNAGRVHLLLAAAPLPRIEQVYHLVFEKILNEKITSSPVIEAGTR